MSDSGFVAYVDALDTLFRDGDPAVQAKALEADNVARMQALVRAFGRGDIAAAAAFFADDIVLEIVAPPEVPFVRSARGRDAVLAATIANFQTVDAQAPVLEAVVAQGDTVVLLLREEGVWRADGSPYKLRGVHRYRFDGGAIALVEEFIFSS
jgi:ketosteroid isomerase-like protein